MSSAGKIPCPKCGQWWDSAGRFDQENIPCMGGCGMEITPMGNYARQVGIYRVYWPHNALHKARVWENNIPLLTNISVPYDVSEDMIRMMLVFQ